MIKSYWPICIFLFFIPSCEERSEGENLAKRHCSTCHRFPEPGLLDKKTWESGVLPEMAFRMGLDISRLPGMDESDVKEVIKTLPVEALVSEQQWNTIRKYYLTNAPDTLSNIGSNKIIPITQFNPTRVKLPIGASSLLTIVRFDPANRDVFIGTRAGKLYQMHPSMELTDSLQLPSAPSDIIFRDKQKPLLLCMGIMDRNDQSRGSVIQLASQQKLQILIDSLKRPVQFQSADLNNDGENDFVISAFGNFTGGLLVYEKVDNAYRKHVIHNFPGNRKTIIKDFNGDGLPDILALMAQGDEQIALFTNSGNFRFSFQVLLKFPPVYGSSYFEVYDFNNDGKSDILYTNGDNSDFSSILKPYHGVRIFLNDGENHFNESWFYPMHGASMAHAFDFDEDGDLDIAAISFFPDFKRHPENSFVYLENRRNTFTAYGTPLASSARWITMESADIDNDDDTDMILGALNFPNGVPDSLRGVWRTEPVSLLILKNNLR